MFQLILKSEITGDPRFQAKTFGDSPGYVQHTFAGTYLTHNMGEYGCNIHLNNFCEVEIPPGLSDYIAGVRLGQEFTCLNTRRQGVYKMEDASGAADGVLERSYQIPSYDSSSMDDAGEEELGDRLPADADAELVRTARLKYYLNARASTVRAAVQFYRGIRSGRILPVEDWDAEQRKP